MVDKKDAVDAAEDVQDVTVADEGTETAEVAETTAETTSEPQAIDYNATPQVAGVDPNKMKTAQERVNVCKECTWIGPVDKGVASCPACGGKTAPGFRYQADAIKAGDEDRFNGKSTEEVNKKDE